MSEWMNFFFGFNLNLQGCHYGKKKTMSFLCGAGDGGRGSGRGCMAVFVVVQVHFLQSHVLVHGKCIDVSDEPTASILRVFKLALCVYLIKYESCEVYFKEQV